jgi:hypothetical protein
MQIETRIAELRREIAAGEYEAPADAVAGAIVAKLVLIRRARRRILAMDGARLQADAAPPTRRFDPDPQPARRLTGKR